MIEELAKLLYQRDVVEKSIGLVDICWDGLSPREKYEFIDRARFIINKGYVLLPNVPNVLDEAAYGQSITKDGKRVDPHEFYKSIGVGGGSVPERGKITTILKAHKDKEAYFIADKIIEEFTLSSLLPISEEKFMRHAPPHREKWTLKEIESFCSRFGRPALEPLDEEAVYIELCLEAGNKERGDLLNEEKEKELWRYAKAICAKYGTRPAVREDNHELHMCIASAYDKGFIAGKATRLETPWNPGKNEDK